MSVATYAKIWKPWVTTAVTEIYAKFGRTSVGTYPGHDPSESLACDFMVPAYKTAAGRAYGQKGADYAWKNSKRLGIWYVIFWGRIISNTRPGAGWLPYFARNSTNDSKNHHNHFHVSFYSKAPKGWIATAPQPGAPAPYSDGWTPALPWVVYLDKQELGVTKSDSVWIIQKALGLKPYDGNYTQAVRDAVKFWQVKVMGDDPENCDGILGPLQAAALLGEHVKVEDKS